MAGLSPNTTYYFQLRSYTPAHHEQQNELWSDLTPVVSAATAALGVGDPFEDDNTCAAARTLAVDGRPLDVSWALDKVNPQRALTLYLVGNGEAGRFWLDEAAGKAVTVAELTGWLTQLEEGVTGAPVNVIIDAPYAGSFINGDPTLSKPGRVILSATTATQRSFASRQGLHFSDHLLTALRQGQHLFGAYWETRTALFTSHRSREGDLWQLPWLDADGNGVPNEVDDALQASLRSLAGATAIGGAALWAPTVADVRIIANLLQATTTDNRETPLRVWALLYAPDYVPTLTGAGFIPEDPAAAKVLLVELQTVGNGRYVAGADARAVAQAIIAQNIPVLSRQNEILVVSANGPQVKAIAKLSDVAWIEENLPIEAHNDYGGGVIIGANTVHTNGYTGQNQVIGVADTGLDRDDKIEEFPDVPNRRIREIFNWPGVIDDNCIASIVDDGTQDVESGHGTHVAVSARGAGLAGPNGVGRGVAPEAELVFQAVENYVIVKSACKSESVDDGYRLIGLPQDVAQLYLQAYQAGVRIHNNSWGASVAGAYTARSARTDAFLHQVSDMTIVFSAGNSGSAVDLLDENNDGVNDNHFPIPNTHEGWGRINLVNATDKTNQFVDDPTGVATGNVARYSYTIPGGGGPLKITLVWNDAPGNPMAGPDLVNNLDLVVTSPEAVTYIRRAVTPG